MALNLDVHVLVHRVAYKYCVHFSRNFLLLDLPPLPFGSSLFFLLLFSHTLFLYFLLRFLLNLLIFLAFLSFVNVTREQTIDF